VGIFSPAATLVFYALLAMSHKATLDAETAFTALAVLAIVTYPASNIINMIPRMANSLASLERIQEYLVKPARADHRLLASPSSSLSQPGLEKERPVIEVQNVTVQSPTDNNRVLLAGINLSVHRASIVMVSGAVGSGKTLLAKVVMGEIAPSEGLVRVQSGRIGLCDQAPWLPNGSIRDVICAFSQRLDQGAYLNAVRLACLDHDLERLARGDLTEIGSRGLALSPGQRQRLVSYVAES